MPAALKRNHWLMNRKPSSIDSHPGHYGSNRAVHSHFRSSEQINHVQLTVPQRHHGHMRTRSLGNDITLAITNGVTVPNEQEVRHPTPSPLPSPTPLTDVKRHTKHRSPPTMVKQASLGAYPDPSQTFNSGNEDEFGESSSLVCFNSYSDGDEDVETVKAQSVPRLISLSVSGDYTQTDPSERFTRSYSEVLPGTLVMEPCVHIWTYMYAYVCMYVCMYVRTYVCMYIRTYVCMYVCTCICMYVHMYVGLYCMSIHTHM